MKGRLVGDTLKAVKVTGVPGHGPSFGLLGKLGDVSEMAERADNVLARCVTALTGTAEPGDGPECEPTSANVEERLASLARRLDVINGHAATILQVITGEPRAVRND